MEGLNNNNRKLKVPVWAIIPFVLAIITFAIGYLFNIQVDLSAKVNDYRQEVQEYKQDLNQINNQLGRILTEIDWIKKAIK